MNEPGDLVRIRHMIDAARRAVEACQQKTRDDLERDDMLVLALTRLLEILGEAAARVTDSTRVGSADIPWREISDTRNRLIHGYFDVDLDIVWRIVSVELPVLIPKLQSLQSNISKAR